MNIKRLFLKLFILSFSSFLISCGSTSEKTIAISNTKHYSEILDVKNVPEKNDDWSAYCFSDRGAWYGFALPDTLEEESLGSFPGPFLMTHGQWLGPGIIRLTLFDNEKNVELKFADFDNQTLEYVPGRLVQKYSNDVIDVNLELCFISNRTSLLKISIKNTGRKRNLSMHFAGKIFEGNALTSDNANSINVNVGESDEEFRIAFPEGSYKITIEDDVYSVENHKETFLGEGESYTTSCGFIYEMNGSDYSQEERILELAFRDPTKVFDDNEHRWNNYINNILDARSPFAGDKSYRNIVVKSLMTLVNNWRSAYGDLHNDGLFPSYAVWYFNGFWAWDSWKHAVALARFELDLAKAQIRSMFDYQDEQGMIADCIYADQSENNYRDSKPPLAAWAVAEVFKESNDIEFVKEMYPKLVKYHEWWYKNRDHDNNGLCEYGSVDGTKVAAMWESGWDDAVRFDGAKMLKNHEGAWSLDQESVDLNSYLYAEKLCLATLAGVIKQAEAAKNFRDEAEELRSKIQNSFFDEATGFFYDRNIITGKLIMVQDPGGWIPLWAQAASQEQAGSVMNVISDTTKFNTYVPFPTVSRDNEKFMSGYWRGAVWIDQAYFGVKGLQNYGYNDLANKLAKKLFDNCEGLKNSQGPIRENYNPITGEGLKVNHFSWSAAHFLLLFRGE